VATVKIKKKPNYASYRPTAKAGTKNDDHLTVKTEEESLKLRKISRIKPLGPEDPIWKLIGRGSSGRKNVSRRHDYYRAKGERKNWRKS